jgi:hypothetical protein
MAAKEIAAKKYVVRSSRGELSLHEALIRKRSNLAWRLLKARILLKADVPEAGEGWGGNQIIEAPTTTAARVNRLRKQLVGDGVAAVLSRAQRLAFPGISTSGRKPSRSFWPVASHPSAGQAGRCACRRTRPRN